MRFLLKLTAFFLSIILLTVAAVGGLGLYALYRYGRDVPEYKQLANYEPPTATRIHAGDGRLLAEFAHEKRVFVPVEATPRQLIQAFLSAEDKTFYRHAGVDFPGIAQAALTNLLNIGSNKRPRGASTITQQVAKNFLLTNEVSIERKIKEIILAFRIERAFDKDHILELYLNEIYLGKGSYGVASAALNYFDKPLSQLTLAESAYLAALPKGPNNYHPIKRHEAAVTRRNWVIGRMLEDGWINQAEAENARAEPLIARQPSDTSATKADYFLQEVRNTLVSLYGESTLYEGGLSVRTSLDPALQDVADRVLRAGLIAYDRRHGWRGAFGTINPGPGWRNRLVSFPPPPGLRNWRLAVVLKAGQDQARIGFDDGSVGNIPRRELAWARQHLPDNRLGDWISHTSQAIRPGDVIAVEKVDGYERILPGDSNQTEYVAYPENSYGLRQIPDIGGALVALDPHTGRVLAISGGYDYTISQFNRATQAKRQPGSAFKPFVYLAALNEGYTPSTLILDAPFVIDQGPGLGKWKPANYTRKFYGPSPMRLGIEKSRNLMTVRLAQTLGMSRIRDYAQNFGLDDTMSEHLSMALGASETTLMKLTTAYAMLANGGKKILPSLIDRIQDRHGKTIFRHDNRDCPDCRQNFTDDFAAVPSIPDNREQVTDPASAYQIVSMLQGVVERGTGRRIRAVGKPLAGKTGTTNQNIDTWFIGFSPDLAVGIYVGFDQPSSLGDQETGSTVAAPIFRDFMTEALKEKPGIPFRVPKGVRLVRVHATTGLPAQSGDYPVILEAFRPGTEPSSQDAVIRGRNGPVSGPDNTSPVDVPSGLY